MKITKIVLVNSLLFAFLSSGFLYFLHHIPVNQAFIDPFSEYIKNYDLMDITCSRFRDKNDPTLFDNRVFIINSGNTDRAKVASCLEFLDRTRVKAVGVDLFFDSIHLERADTLLRDAAGLSENFIFANSFEEIGPSRDTVFSIVSDTFLIPIRKQHYVNLDTDDGFTVRSFKPYHEDKGSIHQSFAVSLCSLFNPESVADLNNRNLKREWINFRRAQFENIPGIFDAYKASYPAYPIISIDKFLKDSSLYNEDYFKDKIVLIGFCGDIQNPSLKDRYYTPLNVNPTGRSFPDMHGVVIHANIISMILDRDYIDELNIWLLYLIVFVIFMVNYLVFIRVSQARLFFNLVFIRLIQVFQFLLLFSASIWLLANQNIKLGFILIITAVILSFELFEFYIHKLKPLFGRWARKLNLYHWDKITVEPDNQHH